MKKTLAIIGAGEGAIPIINKAKSMGITIVAYGRNDSLAQKMVDIFVEENHFDINFIVDSCRKLHVNGVMASSELSTEVAAKVAHELNLPGNEVENGFAGKNKYLMRTRVSQLSSVRQPKFSLYKDDSTYSFPVVVKAIDACGKKGIGIAYDLDDLTKSVQKAQKYSSDGSALIEDYLEGGQEYSIECLSNGKEEHHVIQYTEKESSGPPHFVETGHHQPANLSEMMKRKIDKAASEILSVLGLNCGMAHLEIKIIDNEIYFIEVGARGGGDHISDILTPLSTGFDYYKSAIECHLGIYHHTKISNEAYTGIYFHTIQNKKLKPLFDISKSSSWCVMNTIESDVFSETTGNVETANSGFIIYASDHKITLNDI